jgi:hypothetical protein
MLHRQEVEPIISRGFDKDKGWTYNNPHTHRMDPRFSAAPTRVRARFVLDASLR